ncbi:MAG TPA: DNA endonuclease SmrA [Cellvibrionaceae bacterium]|nr:DNA endonuclease SmrA [Cellvibrionaceae bacterium]HMW70297.1 DNA endonuclease SmrA [Cellvibrionaceae bacterium]HMY40545.1 DNA endonuclease SmrA [Marinagarivorans sp.]HNG58354.1 DNA endonuclease SmrA [Cellvibrionaceae bacterium]
MALDEDFEQFFGRDVKPLNIKPRADLKRAAAADEKAQALRRERAQQELKKALDPLAGEPVELLAPLDIMSFVRPGVQTGVFRSLRLGKYPLDARLDLHKLSADQARGEVYQFIKDCMANEVRTALITHGKGEGRTDSALLKSCVNYWLPQMPEVLAFHTAQKQHGSYGATYVLLKKSERQKQLTREQFTRR